MTTQLAFRDTKFNITNHSGKIWLRGTEIAKALGMEKSDAVSQIYNRNSDEFTEAMTLTLKLSVKGFGNGKSAKDVRVFSLRGAHLIAMFARTEIAKEFRRWVLDILDREIGEASKSRQPKLPKTKTASVNADDLLFKLNLICSTWDAARDDMARFDPAMAAHLNATMNMFWMYTVTMKGKAGRKALSLSQ